MSVQKQQWSQGAVCGPQDHIVPYTYLGWLQIHEDFFYTHLTRSLAAKMGSSASGPKLVPSLRATLYYTAVSAWVSAGVVGAFWIIWHRSSQMQVLQKPWWVDLELSSCHVKPHSAAWQLLSWPQLLVFPTHLPALTSPSKPDSFTSSWHKIPKPVQFLPQQMQAESAELELKHMLKYTHEFIVWVESHTLT